MTDRLRDEIEAEFVVERTGWAAERVQRVTAQLQRDVAPEDRFETLVVWMSDHNAFTCDGKTLYVGRRLLERLPDDDATAFVIAHEIAHHRLGHIPKLSHWSTARLIVLSVLRALWITSAERERDADLLAIEMCLDAGYDLERCLEAMHHLANVSLDYGDVDNVIGRADGRAGSHPPIHARIADVRAHAAELRRGIRFSIDAARARERRRRHKLALGAAGGAAVVAGLILLGHRPDPALVRRVLRRFS